MKRHINRTLLSSLALALTLGCTDVPVSPLGETFSVAVSVSQENSTAIQVDFLWVIDDSASMCQEQASLAQSFSEFIERITSFVNIDYRIAVVTTNMLTPGKVATFRHHKSDLFPFACAEAETQACVRAEQLADASQELKDLCPTGNCDCSNLGEAWTCSAPSKSKNILNCNIADGERTMNSKCRLTCTDAWQCDAGLISAEQGQACKDDDSQCVYKCLNPSSGNDPANSGCVLRPETAECPSDEDLRNILIAEAGTFCDDGTPCSDAEPCESGECKAPSVPFLTEATAQDYFKCIGVVGADQHNDANLEQGLNAAIWALHPNGPEQNVQQAQSFLRDDAYLVIVIVSDEDDCSTADCGPDPNDNNVWKCGHNMKKEKYGTCMCLPDATEGGELRPVADAVNRVKSLKNDPGRVLVAAIVGDSEADPVTQPDLVAEERNSYINSKCNMCPDPNYKHPELFNTYICESASGKADYGSRYVEFVQAFGANGILTNICSDEGVGPALGQIADRIIRVFTKVCLPRQVGSEESLVVRLVGPEGTCGDGSACCTDTSSECTAPTSCEDGSACVPAEEVIAEDDTPDTRTYRLEVSSDCTQTADKKAIVFNSLLPPGTDLLIDYQGTTTPTEQQ